MRAVNALPLLKLHGCISNSTDVEVPLILTIDQYVTHKKCRDRLFARFIDYALEYPIIFVGHGLEDADLRQALMEASVDTVSRPRFWTVVPQSSDRQRRFWETKRISTIPLSFENFLLSLDDSINRALRSVATPQPSHPIERRFVRHTPPSSDLISFLQNDVTYIQADLPAPAIKPKDFYRGYSSGWGAIQQDLDAKRHITDTILSDVVLIEEIDRPIIGDLYVLKGYAGSGKSVVLKRIAWEAAVVFEKLCLYANAGCRLPLQRLIELSELTGERIFLFVDHPADIVNDLIYLIRNVRSRNIPVTIICAERYNEWNIECTSFATYVNELYELRYLSGKEIEWILGKLTVHNSLGTLKDKPIELQIKAFTDTADKQLIVALHEATSGLPFRDIVYNEYSNIQPEQAKNIYLTICALNRLDVPVRAGLIRRVHGVSFKDFEKKFFDPLEAVVYTERYTPAHDFAYRARHPWVAEVVFERALPTDRERHDLYLQIISALDIGYDIDRKAYRGLIRARDLLELISDPLLVRSIYDATQKLVSEDPYHHQQLAIYEMRRDSPNLSLAYEELQKARRLSPSDKSIIHTLADLEIRRAEASNSELKRDRHLQTASDLSQAIMGKNSDSSHGYCMSCKVTLERLQAQLKKDPDDQMSVTRLVRKAEQQLNDGLQQYPGDPFLSSAEARLAKIIGEDKRAINALERALTANPANGFIAKSLSRLYEVLGDLGRARKTLEKCLETARADKAVNAALARLLTNHFPEEGGTAEFYWRRSFTEGDANHQNQFWYARQIFINGQPESARELFKQLGNVRVSPEMKLAVRGLLYDNAGNPKRFTGKVERLESSYAWVSRDGEPGSVYFHCSNCDHSVWDQLMPDCRLSYELGFNYKGLAAVNVAQIPEE